MRKFIILLLASGLVAFGANAQQVIDQVVAEVGNEVVLQSDVEGQLIPYKDAPKDKRELARCLILDQLIQKKVLLTKAKYDSLKVNDDQVESELNRRMQYFVQTYGSEEAIEKFYHKSILEIKNDFRDAVRDQLLEEQMQNKILSDVEPTPSEIKKFYASIPKDSLPYYNTEFEIGQIMIYPQPSNSEKQRVINRLRAMRRDIMDGTTSFSSQAIAYSKDDASALHGGDLGWARADVFDPKFAAAALSLKKDSISDVVESKFGYHIIQMIERKGDMIHVRHILLRPQIGQEAFVKTKSMLDSLRTVIMAGKKDSMFTHMAYEFSQDEETKNRGGMMVDPKTSSSHIPVDELDAVTFDAIDKLQVGDISEPVYYRSPEGKEGYRILYLKSKNAPHKANLKDDYPKIKQMAEEDKKARVLNDWFKKYMAQIYVRIIPEYNGCKNLDKWHNSGTSSITE